MLQANSLTVRRHCAPGLVAGRYQPLADDVTIAGDIRPNLSSAVDSEDKGNRTHGKFDFLRLRRRYSVSICVRRRPPPNYRFCDRKSSGSARNFRVTYSAKSRGLLFAVYLPSTFPPASSSFFLAASASAFGMPSLTGFGAPSTRSFASLRPRPVI